MRALLAGRFVSNNRTLCGMRTPAFSPPLA
jgi:hypothetical protein